MFASRLIIVVTCVFGCMTFQPQEANAQGLVGTCAKVLWKYVGVPLTTAMVERAGELIIDHFAERLQRDGETNVSEDDIREVRQEYERRGKTECEMRRDLEAMYVNQPQPGPVIEPERDGYLAIASCRTSVGIGRSFSSPEKAALGAFYSCVAHGGSPACCRRGTYLVD